MISLNKNLTLLLEEDFVDSPTPSMYPAVEKKKRNVNFNETVERIQVLQSEPDDELSADQKIIFSERM